MSKPGREKLPYLFQDGHIGKFVTTNRIKYGACCVSNYNTRDGFITPRELARTQIIAQTGCGIITNQGAYPDPKGEGKAYFRQIALFDDKFLPQFETIAGYIHDQGAVAIQQILHAGRYGGIDLGYCVQPSVVPQTLPHFRPPRAISKAEIRQTIREHAEAAARSLRAGFDGVEITSFMGYLLANFNSPFTNKRHDEYGGTVQNRGRFMRELIEEIKAAIGDDHPLVVRLNGAELMDRWGGSSEDECFELMRMAAESGADMISVTVGWQEAPSSSIGRDVPPGHWNYLAARAKQLLPDVPIAFGVRLPDPVMANACIQHEEFDFWEVCRPLLADPELVNKTTENRLDEIRPCIGALLCLSRLFRDQPYQCAVNPVLGHEGEPSHTLLPAPLKKNIMVIGAGPAGLECAIAASRRGHRVAIYEKGSDLGGHLAVWATYDKAHPEDLEKLIAYYRRMVDKFGITIHYQTAVNPPLMRTVLHQYDVAVVATGATVDPAVMAILEGGADQGPAVYGPADTIVSVPRVVVLGGGKVGLTVAEHLAMAGTAVTVVEEAPRIAHDVVPSWKWRHSAWVQELHITTLTKSRITGVTNGGVEIVDGQGERQVIAADAVVATGPRLPEQQLLHDLEFLVDELYVVGDAMAARSLHQAVHEGYRLGARI